MKKHLTLMLVLVLGSWLSPAQADTPPADPATEQAITRLREGLVESFNHGDLDRLLTYLDTNAVVTWQNGEVCEGTAAVRTYYERMMKGDHPIVRTVTADPKILGRHIQGDWAVSWGNLNDQFVLSDGRELLLNSRFTATIARRGDVWRVTAFHVSVNAFDNPILVLAAKKVTMISGVAGVLAGLVGGVLLGRLLRRPRSSSPA